MTPLRDQAEAELARRLALDSLPRAAADLLHELQVHQIELEMQNESLRLAMVTLEESRDRYVDLYEFSPVGYLTLTASGQIVEANLTCANIIGLERRQLLTRHFDRFLTLADRLDWRKKFAGTLMNGRVLDVALERGDADAVYIQLDCRPLKSPDGTPGLRIALTDITARKQAEHALREKEAFNRAILDAMPAHIAVLDRAGVITTVNRAWRAFALENGPAATTDVGTNYLDICRGSTGPSSGEARDVHAGIQAVLDGRLAEFSLEYPCHSPLENRWFSMSATPLENHGVVVSHTNITVRKAAEVALRHSEERLRGYYDSSSACMGIVELMDADFLHIYDNPATCRLFGVAPGASSGCLASSLAVPPDLIAAWIAQYRESAQRGAPVNFNLPFDAPGQARRWLDVTVAPLKGGAAEQPKFCYVALDISDLKRVGAELEKSNEELQARTRQAEEASAAKSRFLAGISHELRTPLHTILGYLKLLKKDSSGTVRQQLSIVERSSQQLRQLIDELLEYHRGEQRPPQLRPAPVVLYNSLELVARSARLMALEGRNAFSKMLQDDLPGAVWVDEGRLLQILQNLVGNACNYTRDGRVSLRVTREREPALPAGRCRLRIAVEDTGIGIPPAELAQIFEAFKRGSSSSGMPGLGLGLTVARQWVRAMGGDIEVRSHPGQGSCFSFTLELKVAGADELDTLVDSDAPAVTLQHARPTVLVADDMAENRQLLRSLCETWGCVVVEAVDGATALAACIKSAPPVHMVLADQVMPGLDGWGLLRQLRENPALSHLPVALISAADARRPADFPSGLDFDLVLGKPLDDAALLRFLSERLPPGLTPPPVAAAEDVALPPGERARFQDLLADGRVIDIAAWAQALAQADGAYAPFAKQVAEFCRAANLPALDRLANMPPTPDSPG